MTTGVCVTHSVKIAMLCDCTVVQLGVALEQEGKHSVGLKDLKKQHII